MAKAKGPQFLQYVIPILDVLKENGGSGNASEVVDKVIEKLKLTEKQVEDALPSGESRVRNRIQWARFYLNKAGLIENVTRGQWQLTQDGYSAKLDNNSVYELFRKIHKQYETVKKDKPEKVQEADLDNEIVEDEEHSVILLDILKKLSADGFEKICKRLLTEIGIHDIVITGRSGDQGIDGIGLIKLNDVVNFNIVFQCKKIQRSGCSTSCKGF